MNKNTDNLLRFIISWDTQEDECSEEFLYHIRGKMTFDLDREFPLLVGIDHDDILYEKKPSYFESKLYRLKFSKELITQIHEHYPEHSI